MSSHICSTTDILAAAQIAETSIMAYTDTLRLQPGAMGKKAILSMPSFLGTSTTKSSCPSTYMMISIGFLLSSTCSTSSSHATTRSRCLSTSQECLSTSQDCWTPCVSRSYSTRLTARDVACRQIIPKGCKSWQSGLKISQQQSNLHQSTQQRTFRSGGTHVC